MPLTAEEILARKKPVTRKVTLVLDGEIADAWAAAKERLAAAEAGLDAKETTAARKALEALREEAEGSVVEFVFQAIGRKAYDSLVELHPPTDDDKEEAAGKGQLLLWDAETFSPALISASLIEPKMTEDQVRDMFASENFNQVELAEIFSAAFGVNNTSRVIDLKKG